MFFLQLREIFSLYLLIEIATQFEIMFYIQYLLVLIGFVADRKLRWFFAKSNIFNSSRFRKSCIVLNKRFFFQQFGA